MQSITNPVVIMQLVTNPVVIMQSITEAAGPDPSEVHSHGSSARTRPATT